MISYSEFINQDISEKNILAWIEPSQRILEWTLHSGSIFKKVLNFYLIDLKVDGVSQTKVNSLVELDAPGKYFFDESDKTLYFDAIGVSNPSDVNSVVFYRICFSDYPAILPVDDSLREIEYLPLISSRSRFSHKLDHADQIGIALTNNSSISFQYEDFFIQWYDRLEWANKRCRIWSYSKDLPFSERQIYFDGVVEDRTLSINSRSGLVTFRIKDFLETLKEKLPLDLFSSSDGDIPDSIVGTAKRRIYGRVDGLRVVSLNQILDGFPITGTWTGIVGSNTFTGSGGAALSELSPEDKLIVGEDEYKVESITDDNTIVISEQIAGRLLSGTINAKPEIQSIRTGRNTNHLICDGHALREASTTVVETIQFNRFLVADATDFQAGDLITLGGFTRTIRRVSVQNIITLTQSLTASLPPGTPITKNPVQKVYANGDLLQVDRDYSVENLSTGAKLILDPLAEFNVAVPVFLGTLSFTNGSNVVTSSNVEFAASLKNRDWLKPRDPNYTTWYEILYINEDDNTVTLRSTFTDPSTTSASLVRKIDPIGDNTKVTVECLGKTEDGTKSGVFISTAAQAVRDMLVEAGIEDRLDLDSFDLAEKTADQLISMPLPIDFSSAPPAIGEVITLINKSIFGSIHYKADFTIAYNVLTAEKPAIAPGNVITESDILSWSAKSTTKNITRKVFGQYKFQDADRFTGDKAFSTVESDSDYARYVVETNKERTVKLYLFNELDAETITERFNFINDTSQATITIQTKLKFALFNINDKILLDLDRIYARFGSIDTPDQRKIGIISGISRTPDGIQLEVDDLGNIWNRVANITEDDAVEFTLAGDEKIINGYITDNDELIDQKQDTYKLNLIG